MKAISNWGHGDIYKDAFDRAFSSGMGKIENAFTHLKNSWNVLKCFNFTVPYVGQIIIACWYALHNFCRMNNKQIAGRKVMDAHPNLDDLRVPRRPTTEREPRLATIAIWHVILGKWLNFI